MYQPALRAGTLFAALAVIFGAFGAHALARHLPPEKILIFETGVSYQFYHSFALFICGILFSSFPFKIMKQATIFFIIGIILFCGSLYAMELLRAAGIDFRLIGIITPIGGLFFILGWILLLMGVTKKNQV